MEKFKEFIKSFGKLSVIVWVIVMFVGNLGVMILTNAIGAFWPIITFNSAWITVALIAIFSRYIK